jgi:hypothetical protein
LYQSGSEPYYFSDIEKIDTKMNYPAASREVSKTSTRYFTRSKLRGIIPKERLNHKGEAENERTQRAFRKILQTLFTL